MIGIYVAGAVVCGAVVGGVRLPSQHLSVPRRYLRYWYAEKHARSLLAALGPEGYAYVNYEYPGKPTFRMLTLRPEAPP